MMTLQANHGLYAQTGWLKLAGQSRVDFVEYIKDDHTTFFQMFATHPTGTYVKYEVRRLTGSSPAFQFIAGGVVEVNSAGVTWLPNELQFLGEVHNHNDQMPGGSNNREEFSATQFSHDLRTWTDVDCLGIIAPPGDSTIYGVQKVTNGDYRIWDKACTT
jgi:hypothetical protein